MKILHTGDWHLGKRLDFFSRLEEQKEVLDEICHIADQEQVDAVIVAGDLFDAYNPPVEAIELLYKTLRRLTNGGKRPVIAIAGNHDSADRIDAPDVLARECGILFIGYPNAKLNTLQIENGFSITQTDHGFVEIQLPQYNYPLRVLTTPFANEWRLKQFLGIEDKEQQLQEVLRQRWQALTDTYCDEQGVNMLTAHLYMLQRGGEVLEEPEGEKPLKIGNADIVYSDNIPRQIQYTALGHLHRFIPIAGHAAPVIYASSPLAYSFSEAGQQKYVVVVDAVPNHQVSCERVALTSGRPLHRKRFVQIDEAVGWLHDNPNALVELTLVSDTYLTSMDLKRIHEAHDGIIHIIPVVKQDTASSTMATNSINLDQDIQQLFLDYFRYRTGQEANTEIIDLLHEVIHHESEEED